MRSRRKTKKKASSRKKRSEAREPIVAFLSFQAFLTIVSSSVEVFRKETIGYLVGVKASNKFMVEYAIPYQTAEQGFVHASVDLDRVGRINEIVGTISHGLEFIGDFHSHTVFGDSPGTVIPSRADLKSTIPGEVNIICAVNKKKRSLRWRENSRGILLGTLGEYHIQIGGYFVEAPVIGRIYERVIVRCPSATGMVEEK